jgi:dihydrolipoamide dehydrogenase
MKHSPAIVIGAGPGGYVCAIRLAQLGIETVLVERLPRLGGVCLNWGCIPSKAFISAARTWEQINDSESIGMSVKGANLDFAQTKAWKDQIVNRLTGGIAELMKRHKVTVVHGTARFTGAQTIEIEGEDGTEKWGADNFVIATGSRSIEIPGFAVDQERILTSRGILDLTEVPEHLLVIGGGVIGLEIGMYMMKLGAKLTVVEMMDQLLPGIDPDCVKVVARKLKKAKAQIHLKSKAAGAEVGDSGIEVTIAGPKKEEKIVVDRILVSVGRRPNSEDLGLEEAGVERDDRGFIATDSRMRTSNPAIYAIGDVSGPPLLAHKGSKEGLVAAAVIAGGNDTWDVRAMPAAVFTDPEIATVGLGEAEAKEAGHELRIGSFPFAASGRALAGREAEGMVKMISDAKDDRILGVHMVGPHASELIAEAALAIEAGLTSEDLALTVHTHPTLAEASMEAAEDVHRMAVHIYNPKR